MPWFGDNVIALHRVTIKINDTISNLGTSGSSLSASQNYESLCHRAITELEESYSCPSMYIQEGG